MCVFVRACVRACVCVCGLIHVFIICDVMRVVHARVSRECCATVLRIAMVPSIHGRTMNHVVHGALYTRTYHESRGSWYPLHTDVP